MALEKEVLVKLSLVPDSAAASKITQMEAAIKNLQKQAANVKVSITGGGGPGGGGGKAPSVVAAEKAAKEEQRNADWIYRYKLSKWKEEQREKERSAKEQAKAAERAAKEEQRNADYIYRYKMQQWQQQQRAEQAAAKAAQDAGAKIRDSHLQALNASKGALQGILDMAQGLAVLGLSSEEDLAIFAKQFVKIDAGFRILRGGIETVTNLAAAYRALAAAQTIASGARAAGAGANASSLAGNGFGSQIAARALPLAGTAAKVGGFALAGAEAIQFGRRALGDRSANSESIVGAVGSMLKAQFFDLAKSAEQLKAAEQRRLVVVEAVKQAEISRLSIIGQNRAAVEGVASRRDAASGLSAEAAASAARNRGLSALEQAEAQYTNVRPDNMQAQLSALQNIVSLKEQIASADEASLQAQRENLQTVQQNLKAAEDLLRSTQERVKTETQATKSNLAKFGELDPARQATLRQISSKVQKGGEINAVEAKFLKETGFGGKLTEDFYAKRGDKAGGLEALAGLGEMDNLAAAKAQEVEAAAQVARLKQEEQEAIKKTNEASARLVETLDKLSEALNTLASKQLQGVSDARDEAINPGAKAQQVFQNQRAGAVAEQAGRANRVAAGTAGAFE